MRVSEVNLARAQKRFDTGEYDSAVFHASIAVESAANAMILELGGDEAKDHQAVSALATVLRRVKPELLKEERYQQMIERGREIQREVVYARYPLRVAGRWIAPMDYYTQENAKEVIEDAGFLVEGVKAHLRRSGA